MKKLIIYVVLMILVVVVLPLIIVSNCKTPEEPETANSQSNLLINVYMPEQKKVVKMRLEDYLLGVVAAEMPASYETEALKAQAIAARTYALGRVTKLYGADPDTVHNGADVCTSPAHCQAWISKNQAMKRWGLISSFKYWNRICSAVKATSGQVIEYNKVLINPLFHSNSGGHTENSEDVWDGTAEPYLRGVESPGEDSSSEYRNELILDKNTMIKTLNEYNPKIKLNEKDLLSNIKILKYSEGGRVIDMKVGDINIKGTDFRKIFQLKSTNFRLSKLSDGKISIITLGYGHGVGMSQCGANALAKEGKSAVEILKYYYKDTYVTKY